MEKHNCKKCIWHDQCASMNNIGKTCEDYFASDEEDLIEHLTKERIQYQKEWNVYTNDED